MKKRLRVQLLFNKLTKMPSYGTFEIGELANQIFDLAELSLVRGNQNLITDGYYCWLLMRVLR